MPLLIILTLLASDPASPQLSTAFDDCNRAASSQLEMNRCAADELKRAESELAESLKKLLAHASARKRFPQGAANANAMQAAWVAYRDSYLEAIYPGENKRLEYGSMYPQSAAIVLARLTRQQIAAINLILEEQKPR